MKNSNNTCCPFVSKLERDFLFHNHEANRLRFFGKIEESNKHAALAAIFRSAMLEHRNHV